MEFGKTAFGKLAKELEKQGKLCLLTKEELRLPGKPDEFNALPSEKKLSIFNELKRIDELQGGKKNA